MWKCACDCGGTSISNGYELRVGKVKSCGCHKGQIRHGLSHDPLYSIWAGIKARCENPAHKNFPLYGGRGVRLCAEWLDDPQAFVAWARASGWSKGQHIDRRDNDKGYSPSNCRTVSPRANCNNRNNTRRLYWGGKEYALTELADEIGMKPNTLSARIYQYGWGLEKAITEPVRGRK